METTRIIRVIIVVTRNCSRCYVSENLTWASFRLEDVQNIANVIFVLFDLTSIIYSLSTRTAGKNQYCSYKEH